MESGNFIKKRIEKFKKLDKDKYENEIIESYKKMGIEVEGNLQILFLLSNVGMAVGVMDDGKLSQKEKDFISEVYPKLFDLSRLSEGMDTIFKSIKKGAGDSEYEGLSMILTGYPSAAMPLLDYILCFGYYDGELKNTTLNKLENLFGLYLLADFFKNGDSEEVDDDKPSKKENETKKKEKPLTKEEWQEECKKIDEKRKQAIEDYEKTISSLREDELRESTGELKWEAEKARYNVTSSKKRIKEQEEELKQYSFFKMLFSGNFFYQLYEKKSTKEGMEYKIEHMPEFIENAEKLEKELKEKVDSINNKYDQKIKDFKDHISDNYPYPPKPDYKGDK